MAKTESGSIASDLHALLESGKGADVTIVIGDSQLPAHSQILAARSPVFAAMLQNDMKEASSRRITITDVQEVVLQQVLLFIYTDTAPQLESVAAELLAAADKYDLPLLRERCEQQLAWDMDVENAAATAALAVLHRCLELRSAAVEFIAGHPEVMATAGWAQVLRDNAEIAVEISKQLAGAQTWQRPHLVPPKTATNEIESRIVPEEMKQEMSARLLDAARSGRAREVWALLAAGAPKDARESHGNTALHLAANNEHATTVKYLLDAGLDANAINSSKQTPLHMAAKKRNTDVIWMLVAASAQVDAQDTKGQTPLHVAAQLDYIGHLDEKFVHVVNTLVLAGARKDTKDIKGRTPESVATSRTRSAFSTCCNYCHK